MQHTELIEVRPVLRCLNSRAKQQGPIRMEQRDEPLLQHRDEQRSKKRLCFLFFLLLLFFFFFFFVSKFARVVGLFDFVHTVFYFLMKEYKEVGVKTPKGLGFLRF